MSLRNRIKKLELSQFALEPYVLIWSGIRNQRVPENSVYFADDYELIKSTADDAARCLIKRLHPTCKPALLLVNS